MKDKKIGLVSLGFPQLSHADKISLVFFLALALQ